MRIKKHKNSHIVELADRSIWRIWPADIPKTLLWSKHVDLQLIEIDHDLCSHALLDRATGLRVRVADANESWPADLVRQSLRKAEQLDLRTAALAERPRDVQRARQS